MKTIPSLVVLAAALAASYWYSYRYESQRLQTAIPKEEDAKPVAVPEAQSVVLEQPYREYTVKEGETVYGISKQYGLLWSTVASYNNLPENAVIRPGMVLKIPLNEKGEITRIDRVPKPSDSDIERITQAVKQGTETWYADPVIVTQKTAPDDYHFKHDDNYTVLGLDYTAGTAMIEVIHDGRTIIVSLTQYTPGKGNSWYITSLETR